MGAYASVDQLKVLGVPASALVNIDEDDLEEALESASRKADSYLLQRYPSGITEWGEDLSQAVAAIAAWIVISARRGFNPEVNADRALRQNYEDAIAWLKAVAESKVTPTGIVTEEPEEAAEGGEAFIYTEPSRGW